ncbi:hypothetical protein [Streptomyces sp. NPDC054975]
MPDFIEGVLVTLACAFGVLVGKAQSRPSGRSPEDLAFGLDLLVAAIALQAGILAKHLPGPTAPRFWCLVTLVGLWGLFPWAMKEWGYMAGTDDVKPRAAFANGLFGVLVLVGCYILNTETGIQFLTQK